MEQWEVWANQHRPQIWGCLGLLLCFHGHHFPYTFLFFPMARIADRDSVERIVAHLGGALNVLQSQPAYINFALWRTAQTLACNLFCRIIDAWALTSMCSSAAVVIGTLGLAEAPSEFRSVQLRLVWNSFRADWLAWWQQHIRKCVTSSLVSIGIRPSTQSIVCTIIGQIVCLVDLWAMIWCDRMVGLINNAVLGAELLQHAVEDLCPLMGTSARGVVVGFCGAVGLVGIGYQVRQLGQLGVKRSCPASDPRPGVARPAGSAWNTRSTSQEECD